MSAYGADGSVIEAYSRNIPAYTSFTSQNPSHYTWASSTTDVRALQTGAGTRRIASSWFSYENFDFALNITDGNTHQIAIYALDWDHDGRIETIAVSNAKTGAVLDTRVVSNFTNGLYLVWNISGDVKITVTHTGGVNAAVSGVFFGGAKSVDKTAPVTTPPPAPAVVAPAITMQPASQTILAGKTATFSVADTGTAPLTYQWNKNGAAISGATLSAYTTPAVSASDNGSQFTVSVSNSAATVNSSAAVLTVNPGTPVLTASVSSVSFGNVNVSSSASQNVTLTNTGTANVTISNVSISGAGFNAGGVPSGSTLQPGQSATLNATFAPAASGSASGKVSISSNASTTALAIALCGTGVATAHTVSLTWAASTSNVVGYNAYFSLASGGPYTKLTSSPVPATDYNDTSAESGQTRFYVITSVNSSNEESAYSSQVSAQIP